MAGRWGRRCSVYCCLLLLAGMCGRTSMVLAQNPGPAAPSVDPWKPYSGSFPQAGNNANPDPSRTLLPAVNPASPTVPSAPSALPFIVDPAAATEFPSPAAVPVFATGFPFSPVPTAPDTRMPLGFVSPLELTVFPASTPPGGKDQQNGKDDKDKNGKDVKENTGKD